MYGEEGIVCRRSRRSLQERRQGRRGGGGERGGGKRRGEKGRGRYEGCRGRTAVLVTRLGSSRGFPEYEAQALLN